MATRIGLGDVYSVPADDGKSALIQVVGRYEKKTYWFAVFALAIREQEMLPQRITETLEQPVVLLGLSFDAKIHVGQWMKLGNYPVRPDLPMPAFREAVTTFDHVDVVDFTGMRRRRASKDEDALLPNRRIISPIVLEKAIQASRNRAPWEARFDDLKPHGITSRELFG